MKIKGNDYNFGRVIYLTFIRDITNAQLQKEAFTSAYLENKGVVTIAFDPKRNPQLNTRIDFYVKHLGDAMVGNNGVYATANIDVYNIGPALQDFFDAYNAYKFDGHFKDVNTKKFGVVLQVGYSGGAKTTVFAGHVSSFVVERQQNNSTIDNVWHFFCQFPSPIQTGVEGDNKAVNGTDYSAPEYWNPNQSLISWEQYLKLAIMAHDRETYSLEKVVGKIVGESFSETDAVRNYLGLDNGEESLMCLASHTEKITPYNFDKHYSIVYKVTDRSPILEKTKKYWQQKVGVTSWNLNVANLQQTVNSIARATNCHARIELSETGHSTIYIYPAGIFDRIAQGQERFSEKADYIIVDYQNLRNPPQVSANMFQVDMIMEPDMRPGNTIELQISQDFLDKHPHPTFQPNFSMANTATVFAGANFMGLAQMNEDDRKRQAIASAGNIFYTQFITTIVEHRGSSHLSEWSTKADCYGVVSNGQRRTL